MRANRNLLLCTLVLVVAFGFLGEPFTEDASGQQLNEQLMDAVEEGNLEFVKLLIAKGADVNEEGFDGHTALGETAQLDNLEMLELLIGKGADVNAKNGEGHTAVRVAKDWHYQEDMVKYLKSRGAK
jgi:ankyrin repeat protein